MNLKRHFWYKLHSVYCTYGCVCSYSAVWDPAVMVVLLRSSQLCRQLSRINVGMELSHWTQHYHLKNKIKQLDWNITKGVNVMISSIIFWTSPALSGCGRANSLENNLDCDF